MMAVIVQLTQKFYIDSCISQKQDRREHLIKGDLAEYTKCIQQYQQRYQELQRLVTNAVIDKFEVSDELWNRSANFYSGNEMYARQMYPILSTFIYKN